MVRQDMKVCMEIDPRRQVLEVKHSNGYINGYIFIWKPLFKTICKTLMYIYYVYIGFI